MMRVMGTIFEKKHAENFETFCEQLLAVPRISFSLYQDVVRTVGNAQTDQCPMSYGRLVREKILKKSLQKFENSPERWQKKHLQKLFVFLQEISKTWSKIAQLCVFFESFPLKNHEF